MKKLQAPFAGLLLVLLAASCKKDVEELPAPAAPTEMVAMSAQPAEDISESSWTSGGQWTSAEESNHTSFSTDIKANINGEVLAQGLVRVFKTNSDGSVRSLPFSETVNGTKYDWYYQVSEGNVTVSVDAQGSKLNPGAQAQFKTVVFTPGALSDLKSKGTDKGALMSVKYDNLQSLKN